MAGHIIYGARKYITPFSVEEEEYVAEAVTFDGSDYLKTTTGAATTNSGLLTFSCWFKTGNTATRVILWHRNDSSPYGGVWIQLAAGDTFSLVCEGDLAAKYWTMSTVTTYTDDVWHHVLASIDTSDKSISKLYIDDSNYTFADSWSTSGDITFNYATAAVGARSNGTIPWYEDLAEVYYAPGEYLDLTVESNRRKFIDADGKPVNLLTSGAPDPLIYCKGIASTWNAGTQYGSSSGWSMTGSVADSSNEPVELP